MGHRLTQIYTRTGDGGTTSIGTGERIAKDDLRVHLMGEVDELNALVGLILAHPLKPGHRACLEEIQHLLFDLGGDLAIPGRNTLKLEYIEWLERWMDFFNDTLPPLKEFVLPGGSERSGLAHLARTLCRKAERTAVHFQRETALPAFTLELLNRLSDFLFVFSRVLAKEDQDAEVLWMPKARTLPEPSESI